MVGCKGLCNKTAPDMHTVARRHGMYKQGFVWCSSCQKWFKFVKMGDRCECCTNKFRIHPNTIKLNNNKNINKNNFINENKNNFKNKNFLIERTENNLMSNAYIIDRW